VVGLPTQSSKGLRVATQCRDVDQFVRTFHRFCEDSNVFISHARRSVGEVVAFSFELADGSAALSGLGAVVEQFASADNRFGRPGVVIALHRLARNARRVFDDLSAARVSARDTDRRDTTPIPLAEARAYTSDFQMLDADALTPIPQLPPRPTDAFPPLPKPLAAKVPDVPVMSRTATVSTDVPMKSRTATVSIAAIAVRPPATRTPPPGIKIPTIVAPTAPVVAKGTPIASVPTIAEGTTPPATTASAEVAHADPVDEPPAIIHAPPIVVEAPAAPIVATVEAVIEQPDAMAEQTVRMATPPYGALVAMERVAPIVETAAAYEWGATETPRLSPAPIELLGERAPSPVAAATTQPDAFTQTSAPAMIEEAIAELVPVPASLPLPAVAHAAPGPVSAPMSVVFASQPAHAQAPTRWTKRRIWAVAVLAGSSLLALGIVIGATFIGNGARERSRAPEAASSVSPTPAPPAPTPAAVAPTPAAPAPTPVAASPTPVAASPTPVAASPTPAATSPTPAAESPTPAAESPTPAAAAPAPTEPPPTPVATAPTPAAPPPAAAPVAAAAPPARGGAKAPARPKTPPKKPAHAKHHHHAA
jgi:hypothetical protein